MLGKGRHADSESQQNTTRQRAPRGEEEVHGLQHELSERAVAAARGKEGVREEACAARSSASLQVRVVLVGQQHGVALRELLLPRGDLQTKEQSRNSDSENHGGIGEHSARKNALVVA